MGSSRHEFRAGDRVRVAASCRYPFCSPGDTGTVVWASHEWPAGVRVLFYHVRLDGAGGRLALLYPHELEPATDG